MSHGVSFLQVLPRIPPTRLLQISKWQGCSYRPPISPGPFSSSSLRNARSYFKTKLKHPFLGAHMTALSAQRRWLPFLYPPTFYLHSRYYLKHHIALWYAATHFSTELMAYLGAWTWIYLSHHHAHTRASHLAPRRCSINELWMNKLTQMNEQVRARKGHLQFEAPDNLGTDQVGIHFQCLLNSALSCSCALPLLMNEWLCFFTHTLFFLIAENI